jgi:hypothetical protein
VSARYAAIVHVESEGVSTVAADGEIDPSAKRRAGRRDYVGMGSNRIGHVDGSAVQPNYLASLKPADSAFALDQRICVRCFVAQRLEEPSTRVCNARKIGRPSGRLMTRGRSRW